MTRKLFLFLSVILCSAVVAEAAGRFTVDDVGSIGTPLRILQAKATAPSVLYDENTGGTSPLFLPGVKAIDANKAKVKYDGVPTGAFDGSAATANLSVTFGKVGAFTSTFDVGSASKKLLVKSTAKPVTFESAPFYYNVNVLQQRKLKVAGKTLGGVFNKTLKFGDVLRGAKISTSYEIATKNKADYLISDSATHVTVATGNVTPTEGLPGVALNPLNALTVSETLINDGSAVSYAAVNGRLQVYDEKLKVKKILLPVVSAELDSAGDFGSPGASIKVKAYKDLKVNYTANVGIAKKYQKKPGKDNPGSPMEDFGAAPKVQILSADILAGEDIASYGNYSLSSMVRAKGTLADPLKDGLILPGSVDGNIKDPLSDKVDFTQNNKGKWKASKANLKKLYKAVGSEAEIVSSYYAGAGSSPAGDVTQQWRVRTPGEANAIVKGIHYQLPLVPPESGPKWLTSDVVKVGGSAITGDVYYVLQMTFDNRINLAFEGQIKGQIDEQWRDLWIGQLNTTELAWERAAVGSGHYDDYDGFGTLTTFLDTYLVGGTTLEDLAGNWGVDEANQKSWAIVKGGGSGIFAVVPEPATVIMMLSAALGAMAYGWRRWSRKPELV